MLGLDGLRGLAILVVIGFHESAFLPAGIIRSVLQYGWVGVDLFFVLSGFLITGILLRALPRAETEGPHGYFQTFYARRSLRIFPIYFVYLAVAYLAYHSWAAPTPIGVPWYISYLANMKPGFGQYDGGFGHLWSLSVEEQFYIFWPLLVLLAGPKKLAHICWSFIIGALALRCWMKWGLHVRAEGIHRLTPARIDTFAIGALVALYLRTHRSWITERKQWFWAAALVLILAGGSLLHSSIQFTVDWSLLAAGFGLLLAVVAAAGFLPMEWAPLRKIGALSYSMYLFHQLVFMKVLLWLNIWGLHSMAIQMVTGFLLTVLTAEITGRFIEAPFNNLKERFSYRPKARQPTGEVAAAQ